MDRCDEDERRAGEGTAQSSAAAVARAQEFVIVARNARARTKLSQDNFAKGVGASPEDVRNWERGTASPCGHASILLRIICNAPEVAFEPLLDALTRYVQTGYASDELLLDRRIENAMDEIEAQEQV